MEKLYTVSKNETWNYGPNGELLIAKFRLKLKKKKQEKISHSDMTLIRSLMIIQWK